MRRKAGTWSQFNIIFIHEKSMFFFVTISNLKRFNSGFTSLDTNVSQNKTFTCEYFRFAKDQRQLYSSCLQYTFQRGEEFKNLHHLLRSFSQIEEHKYQYLHLPHYMFNEIIIVIAMAIVIVIVIVIVFVIIIIIVIVIVIVVFTVIAMVIMIIIMIVILLTSV